MSLDDEQNDPLLLKIYIVNLFEVLFFSQDFEISEDCINAGVIYSNEAWNNSVFPYAKSSFSPKFMKKNEKNYSHLEKYAQPFEMETYLFEKFPLSLIANLKIFQWKKIPKA